MSYRIYRLFGVLVVLSILVALPGAAPAATTPTLYLPLLTRPGGDLAIDGIELIQSVQTAVGDMPLVAQRATIARIAVYAESATPALQASVEISARRNGVHLDGSPLRIAAYAPPASTSRATYTSTLNVPLPSTWASGTVELRATVDPDNQAIEVDEANNSFVMQARFHDVAPLRITIVPIAYTHLPDGASYLPIARDPISDWIGRAFPTNAVEVNFRAPVSFAGDLRNGNEWVRLLEELTSLKFFDSASSTDIYYGLVAAPGASWAGDGVIGIGWIGLRVGAGLDMQDDDFTGQVAAHEIGHTFGRYHSPCPVQGFPASSLDLRFPYTDASIGPTTLGFDSALGQLLRPGAPDFTRDIMSYCTPAWVSDYTYRALFDVLRADHNLRSTPYDRALTLRIHLDADGVAELRPIYQLSAAPVVPAVGENAQVELFDAVGTLLGRHRVMIVDAEQPHAHRAEEGTQAPISETTHGSAIYAVIPAPVGEIATVRLLRSGKVAQLLALPAAEKSGMPLQASIKQNTNGWVVRWQSVDVPVLVRYHANKEPWRTLAVDAVGGELRLDPGVIGTGTLEVTPAGGGAAVTIVVP